MVNARKMDVYVLFWEFQASNHLFKYTERIFRWMNSIQKYKEKRWTGNMEILIIKLYAYTTKVTWSDSKWSKRKREFETVMKQKILGTDYLYSAFHTGTGVTFIM